MVCVELKRISYWRGDFYMEKILQMVGFITQLPIEEDSDNVSKVKTFQSPLDSLDLKNNDLSFADSFLDFDSIKEWFEDKSIEDTESGVLDRSMEEGKEQCSESMPTGDQIRPGLEPNVRPTVGESEQHIGDPNSTSILCKPVVDVLKMKVEEEVLNADADVRFCVENEMGKVSLVDRQEISILDQSNGKRVSLSGDGENRSSCLEESESEGSSSSSSSSDDDDDEEEEEEEEEEDGSDNEEGTNDQQKIELKMAGKTEVDEMDNLEEGEIRDGNEIEIVHANGNDEDDDGDDDDDDDDEDEEGGGHMNFGSIELDDTDDDEAVGVPKGPIRSKNEVERLPPVPKVDVVLQPHHQILPVGVILSVIGTKVIVEGSEKHNPLSEGSILWITESKSPIGLVDEIFGPVKNPYYVVRYNSEAEVPVGIYEGALVSFVPEFADHVLNDKNLYKKGYDVSGENDEEVSDNEFSDDEKEAEYRKMQKLAKRGMNDQRPGNKNNKKVQHKGGPWRNDRHPAEMRQPTTGESPANSNRYNNQMESGNSQSSQPVMQPSLVSGAGLVPPFPVMKSAGFVVPATGSGMWLNRMPSQQLQAPFFQTGFSNGAMPPIPLNGQLHPYQMPMLMPNPMFMPFQQQMFDPSQCSLPNNGLPGGQPNFRSSGPWTGNGMQVGFNQSISGMMSLHGQQSNVNVQQGVLPSAQQPSVPRGNFGASFTLGGPPSGNRRKFFRGRPYRK